MRVWALTLIGMEPRRGCCVTLHGMRVHACVCMCAYVCVHGCVCVHVLRVWVCVCARVGVGARGKHREAAALVYGDLTSGPQ